MSLVRIKNETLIDKREATYLTAPAAAAATTLTVTDNSNFITDNDYYLVGKIGSETAEIVQNNSSTTIGTSITIDREGGAGGLRFAHAINTPVYRIDYNQLRIDHSTSTSTSDVDASNINSSQAIQFDDTYTRYNDTTYTTGYYFVRFYNATSAVYSSYSSAIPIGGHTQKSLWEIARKVYRLLGLLDNDDMDESKIKFSEVRRAINDKERDVVHSRMWTFAEGERSFSTVDNQFRYVPTASVVNLIYSVSHDSKPLEYIDRITWEQLHIDSDTTASYATRFNVWNNEIYLWPKPDTDASATAINDATNITATDTTITVDSTSGFRSIGGFYRFIIGSEVIYATAVTSTTFTGCLRGREGTTAATHNDDVAVTERDIVYSYQVEPTELSDITDETIIPEPEILAYGVAADFARGTLKDNALSDRLELKYKDLFGGLLNKYQRKVKSSFRMVKDVLDTLEGRGLVNPNDYPQSLTGV